MALNNSLILLYKITRKSKEKVTAIIRLQRIYIRIIRHGVTFDAFGNYITSQLQTSSSIVFRLKES